MPDQHPRLDLLEGRPGSPATQDGCVPRLVLPPPSGGDSEGWQRPASADRLPKIGTSVGASGETQILRGTNAERIPVMAY